MRQALFLVCGLRQSDWFWDEMMMENWRRFEVELKLELVVTVLIIYILGCINAVTDPNDGQSLIITLLSSSTFCFIYFIHIGFACANLSHICILFSFCAASSLLFWFGLLLLFITCNDHKKETKKIFCLMLLQILPFYFPFNFSELVEYQVFTLILKADWC